MKRELHGGVVVGVLVLVGLVAIVLGWRALSGPGPAGIKSFDKASLQVMKQEHAKSADDIRQEQMRMLQQARGGSR